MMAAVIQFMKSNNPQDFETITKLKNLRSVEEQICFYTLPGCCFQEHV